MQIPDPISATPPVSILFALPEEAKSFQTWSRAQYEHMQPVPIAISGAGKRNAAKAAEALRLQMARCLLICGFAGGLAAELTPGMLVVGEQVTDSTGEVCKADSRLVAVAESVRAYGIEAKPLFAMRGTIYTGDRVLTTSREKQELARQSGAIAVDMETFAAVQVVQEAGIPWLAVRVITDSVHDDMPLDFNALADVNGDVDRGRVIAATLTHPWKIPALIRLGARSSLAAKNLAQFLAGYLRALPDVNG